MTNFAKERLSASVEVISAKIVKCNDRNAQFVPATSSPFTLIVNEGAALVQNHDAPTCEQYKGLLTQPVKSVTSAKSLKAISDNIEALCDRFVDLLVVVTFVSTTINKVSNSITLYFSSNGKQIIYLIGNQKLSVTISKILNSVTISKIQNFLK